MWILKNKIYVIVYTKKKHFLKKTKSQTNKGRTIIDKRINETMYKAK